MFADVGMLAAFCQPSHSLQPMTGMFIITYTRSQGTLRKTDKYRNYIEGF
jgi:hypothetical protein